MKTPRDILLARHQQVGPQLDAIRRRAVAAVQPSRSWFALLTEALRLPRPAWATLAAAWLVIIVLNVASSETPGAELVAAAGPAKPSPETLQALREQKQLFTELVGALPTADAPRFAPRPRSERCSPIAFA